MLFGERVRNPKQEQVPTEVMLVLKNITTLELDALSEAVQQGVKSFGLSIMVVTPEDLERSTDVFPIKFANIYKHHRILYGKDPLQNMQFDTDHLRLRTEQELKNMQLRLRRSYVLHSDHPERFYRIIESTLSIFFMDLEALYQLHSSKTAPDKEEELIQVAAEYFNLDEALLQQLLGLKKKNRAAVPKDIRSFYTSFLSLVENLGKVADRLESKG